MSTTKSPQLWRQIQKTNFTSIDTLAEFLELSQEQKALLYSPENFTLNLPVRLAQKMEKGNINNPIFRQFVPLKQETIKAEGFFTDPVEDGHFRQATRFLKKYNGRALLLASSACAMHCRYCFRQNLDYGTTENFTEELALIHNDPTLNEVILSGGDPLSLSDQKLEFLLNDLESCLHITKVRFHTRFIIGIPERISEPFLELLKNRRYKIYFIVHVNHPLELDYDVLMAIDQLQKIGVMILNQAVLLKGVNDDFDVQLKLHQKLIDHAIIPYYLHQLDKIEQGAHFEVPTFKGLEIIEYLKANLPGYGVSKYVQEIPQKPSKTTIMC